MSISPKQRKPETEPLPASKSQEDPWFKLKVFAVVETVAILIALVLPITPSKTGRQTKWPETWGDYFDEVLVAFALGNALLLIIFVGGWIYIRWSEGRD